MNINKFKNWRHYKDVNCFKLFFHCLIMAYPSDGVYKNVTIRRGEFPSSIRQISNDSGLTIQQVRTALKKLGVTQQLTQVVTQQKSSQVTVFQVVNYDNFNTLTQVATQELTHPLSRVCANNGLIRGNSLTSNNNYLTKEKEEKKVKRKEEKIHRAFKHLSISEEEYLSLLKDYKPKEVAAVLDRIENYAQNTRYTSLYLTARDWLQREHPQKKKYDGNF